MHPNEKTLVLTITNANLMNFQKGILFLTQNNKNLQKTALKWAIINKKPNEGYD
jgi:hypothetical protein